MRPARLHHSICIYSLYLDFKEGLSSTETAETHSTCQRAELRSRPQRCACCILLALSPFALADQKWLSEVSDLDMTSPLNRSEEEHRQNCQQFFLASHRLVQKCIFGSQREAQRRAGDIVYPSFRMC
ncbi:hypothetical protein HJG60_008891 [Phyllostomus discolor]|uniref:Uncharacterized protein n=1 Tax=Phyllostomus discolor TaxID=89673 RepID=A0A833YTL6_9CHIR|nr:hypothetical protein HJG60_008891 [Phyllostomus discolor]